MLKLALKLVSTLIAEGISLFIVPISQADDSPEQIATGLFAKYAAFKNAKDATKISKIYADGYLERSGRNPLGIAARTQNWQQQFAAMPDIQVTVPEVISSGDKVVAKVTYSATHTTPFSAGIAPTGKSNSLGTIDIWRIENGKFAEHWD